MRKYEHENAKTAMQKAWQLCVIFMKLLKTEIFPDENDFDAAGWAAAARADELVANAAFAVAVGTHARDDARRRGGEALFIGGSGYCAGPDDGIFQVGATLFMPTMTTTCFGPYTRAATRFPLPSILLELAVFCCGVRSHDERVAEQSLAHQSTRSSGEPAASRSMTGSAPAHRAAGRFR